MCVVSLLLFVFILIECVHCLSPVLCVHFDECVLSLTCFFVFIKCVLLLNVCAVVVHLDGVCALSLSCSLCLS